jgi:hypothetical protein
MADVSISWEFTIACSVMSSYCRHHHIKCSMLSQLLMRALLSVMLTLTLEQKDLGVHSEPHMEMHSASTDDVCRTG